MRFELELPDIYLPETLTEILAERPDLKELLDKHVADAKAFFEVFAELLNAEYDKRGFCRSKAAKFQASFVLPKGIYDQIEHRLR